MSTPHIEANPGDIAETVLLPGDPLRAKYVAENFLTDAVCFNRVRNMFGFTGTYDGRQVSVMGTGMGMPSIGIYSHELITAYGVKNLIRIGTAGAYSERIAVGDLLAAGIVSTDSNWAGQFHVQGTLSAGPSFSLLKKADETAAALGKSLKIAHIKSADVFYEPSEADRNTWIELGVDAVEMESYALYVTAMRHRVNALCLLQISDHVITGDQMPPAEREQGLNDMIRVALKLAASL
ncbi:MAG TPA: purine-nucleoside phosphorylase [Clostridiaceae bacterium]|jgi:purine-nucleoside phosphorylase|nr:purine-nucleoside phosphorylase [Clostridiaceae bacterium]